MQVRDRVGQTWYIAGEMVDIVVHTDTDIEYPLQLLTRLGMLRPESLILLPDDAPPPSDEIQAHALELTERTSWKFQEKS